MELYNKEKKKAEVSMRKKGWKDNEDSSLEKFMEVQKANKRVRKDMDALISVSRMFKYDMKVMVGKAVYMFKIFEDWIKRDNAASYISEKASVVYRKYQEYDRRITCKFHYGCRFQGRCFCWIRRQYRWRQCSCIGNRGYDHFQCSSGRK